MRAMVLEKAAKPLCLKDVVEPEPGAGEIRVRVSVCGLCRTDLHIIDGELTDPKLPLIIGHQIVGIVDKIGPGVSDVAIGQRVGVPWLGWTCGGCYFCCSGRENLCDRALFTGYTRDGGFAEYAVADAGYCVRIPPNYSDIQAAPLLCAGLIGYRAYSFVKDAEKIGIYGFGSAAHILTQIAVFEGKKIFAFSRPGDHEAQSFARSLGAVWSGGSDEKPPEKLEAAIVFAPLGSLVPTALASVIAGGSVICGGIHMSDIPSFSYHLLWGERSIRSVANLTRHDAEEFMQIAASVMLKITVKEYMLNDANEALEDMRKGRLSAAAVVKI